MTSSSVLPSVILVEGALVPSDISRSVRQTTGPFVLVLAPESARACDDAMVLSLFQECRALNADRFLTIISKDDRLLRLAEQSGWMTVSQISSLKEVLQDHPSLSEALRIFSPVFWRESVRTTLQNVGILSLPTLRILLLFSISVGVFLFALFTFLPSCTITITPQKETGNFTTNVYLMSSGAIIPTSSEQVRTLPLVLLTVTANTTLTYDHITKKFTGTNARMEVTVLNDTDEEYSLRSGTRLLNQAGMRFRLQDAIILPPHSSGIAVAIADPLDQYGEVLGERGNVPAGIKWDFPGLSEQTRQFVYARNEKPASGGKTSFITILTTEDIDGSPGQAGAKQQLEQALLLSAKQQVQEEIMSRNDHGKHYYVELKTPRGEGLNKLSYSNFSLSRQFIGQQVQSIPVEGTLQYTVVLYDQSALLSMLQDEVTRRVPQGQEVLSSSLVRENMDVHIIPPWDDDLQWVKITADLTYTQQYVFNPLLPSGAVFSQTLRRSVLGKSKEEALKILKNIPEVSNVAISLWPPWSGSLPSLESAISIREE